MKAVYGILLTSISILSISGCAVKYQCPTPNGFTCKSAPDVYRATNAPGAMGIAQGKSLLSEKGHGLTSDGPPSSQPVQDAPASKQRQDPPVSLPSPGDVVPIRDEGSVMRVWIAPWQDASGDLVMATRIYTEMDRKKWAIGDSPTQETPTPFPMEVGQPLGKSDEHKPAPAEQQGLNVGSDL